ncbi:hypothetical protein HF324_31085 [Chitinophaga oryzae]|uniref:HNH endonuclease n=1 Tax=Chitinophaga oryzae TaxID=2725414 RepID=A0ABX6LPG6_9BACT|nr:hypothetical protein [Chitinophaga oryzae]QJB42051.1 hypothetical protein HF324_31085 [Chitinophaga oryzae]
MITPNDPPYRYLQFKSDQLYRRYIQKDGDAKRSLAKPQEHNFLNEQSHGSYGALLFHPDWKARRKEVLQRDGYRCVHCRSDRDLQVHHRQYHFIAEKQRFRLPWDYPGHLLITLCESCHSKGHYKFKVPTIIIK